jgi:4-hydroxybenzoate polyprenyltransferase
MSRTPESPDSVIPTAEAGIPPVRHSYGDKRPTGRKVLSSLQFELLMAWRINVGDFPNTVVPYTCLCIGAFAISHGSLAELPQVLAKVVAFAFLFIYAFAAVNQLISIDEDRANKPGRPLACGIISRAWMVRRAVATNILFAAVGFMLSIPGPTLIWLALIHIHKFCGLYRHWLFKNVAFITIGAGVQCVATWGLVSPNHALPWRWICVTSVLAGIGGNTQDIRDVLGDRLVGRRTMSIAWGEDVARRVLAIILILIPFIQYGAVRWPIENLESMIALAIPAILVWASAIRFLLLTTPSSDNVSFQVFCLWWCSALLLQPLAVLSHGSW